MKIKLSDFGKLRSKKPIEFVIRESKGPALDCRKKPIKPCPACEIKCIDLGIIEVVAAHTVEDKESAIATIRAIVINDYAEAMDDSFPSFFRAMKQKRLDLVKKLLKEKK